MLPLMRGSGVISRIFHSNGRLLVRSSSSSSQGTEEKVDPVSAYTATGGLKKPKRDVFHYSDRKSGTGYSHFSSTIYENRPYLWPPLRKMYKYNYFIVFVLALLMILDYEKSYEWIRHFTAKYRPQAAQITSREKTEVEESSDSEEEKAGKKTENKNEVEKKEKKGKIGFRERRIIEYEDRLRLYSTPEKIFRYFATLKVGNDHDPSGRSFEVFMTPQDFVRSFTPGVMQPRRYGLDKFRVYDPNKYKHNFSNPESIFYRLGEKGLISFTSPKDFELAFQIFDTNGDGALDIEEFRRVQFLVMSQSMVGQRHRDHSTASSSFKEGGNSVLENYFFGVDKTEPLTPEKFLQFQAKLHRDVLEMEYERRRKEEGREENISYESFAEMLIQYAQINEKKKKVMIKRMKKQVNSDEGVTLQEVLSFFHVLLHIEDLETALHFHTMARVAISPALFKRVARAVSGVDLPERIIFVVTALFDENGDGKLSNEEFISIVRRRLQRGLERPRDTGFFRLVEALIECGGRAATSYTQ